MDTEGLRQRESDERLTRRSIKILDLEGKIEELELWKAGYPATIDQTGEEPGSHHPSTDVFMDEVSIRLADEEIRNIRDAIERLRAGLGTESEDDNDSEDEDHEDDDENEEDQETDEEDHGTEGEDHETEEDHEDDNEVEKSNHETEEEDRNIEGDHEMEDADAPEGENRDTVNCLGSGIPRAKSRVNWIGKSGMK